MNTFLWSCAALVSLFVTVDSLSCYTCDAGIPHSCCREASVNCTNAEDICYSTVAKFSPDIHERISQKGCIEQSSCENGSITDALWKHHGSILNVNYTITWNCCSSSLCNGAASIQLPLIAALGSALVAVWSQWAL